jgi:hypothetical protein
MEMIDKRSTRVWPETTHCKRGHEYTPNNTTYQFTAKGTTTKKCKACTRENYHMKKKVVKDEQ